MKVTSESVPQWMVQWSTGEWIKFPKELNQYLCGKMNRGDKVRSKAL